MEQQQGGGGGSWGVIGHVTSPPHSNHDHSQFYQQQQQQQTPQQSQQQSLASHFHLLQLVQDLAEAIDNGTRDHHSDALVNELNNRFEQCQKLLTSISASLPSKSLTVEGQKQKLEETEHLLNQRRELKDKYKRAVEDLIKNEL